MAAPPFKSPSYETLAKLDQITSSKLPRRRLEEREKERKKDRKNRLRGRKEKTELGGFINAIRGSRNLWITKLLIAQSLFLRLRVATNREGKLCRHKCHKLGGAQAQPFFVFEGNRAVKSSVMYIKSICWHRCRRRRWRPKGKRAIRMSHSP